MKICRVKMRGVSAQMNAKKKGILLMRKVKALKKGPSCSLVTEKWKKVKL